MFKLIFYLLYAIIILLYPINKTNIKFLNKEDAKKIYNSNEYKEYEKLFKPKEINYKIFQNVDQYKLKDFYIENVIEIQKEHKKMLTDMCKISDDILIKMIGITIDWKIICFRDRLDWSFPYTINGVIFLNKKELDEWSKEDKYYGISY